MPWRPHGSRAAELGPSASWEIVSTRSGSPPLPRRVVSRPAGRGGRARAARGDREPLRLPPRRAVLPRRREASGLGVRRSAGADAVARPAVGVAFGETPRGLRVVSAVAIAIVVVLVALIARELGAGRAGQAIAALATAASGAAMAVGHLLSTTTFDILVWVTVVLLVARILGGGDERQWLLVGLVVGVGLENKNLVLLLLGALACGCLLDRRFGLARSRWLWAGAALAVALWVPNLLWQAQPRLAAARARRQDRQRGPDRQPGAAAAASAAAHRPAPRAALDRRALVAPPPRPRRARIVRSGSPTSPCSRRLRRRSEAVLHDGPAARAARRGSRRRRATARGRGRRRGSGSAL